MRFTLVRLALVAGLLMLLAASTQAAPAGAPAGQAGTPAGALFLLPLGERDPFADPSFAPLFQGRLVLDVLRLEGQPHLLLQASPDATALQTAGFEARLLAAGRPGTRPYWAYRQNAVVPLPAEPLLADGQRELYQLGPAEAEALGTAGARLIELRPLAPAHVGALPTARVTALDPQIAAMIGQVTQAALAEYVGDLSGEHPVQIGGAPTTLRTRYSGTTGMYAAAQYLRQHYEALGLPVELWPYGTRGWTNIVATQTGRLHPEQVLIICAHYDDTSTADQRETLAPGADDNASGSAAVLLAADILSQYAFDYTIRYVHFSGEEQGLWGSAAYAHQSANLHEEIVGVLNLDMIAWDSADGPAFDVHARGPASENIADVFAAVVSTYGLNLDVQHLFGPDAPTYSDHASFWNESYPAILGIEDGQDFNAYYHSISDLLSRLNLPYFTNAVKAAVGTLATLASPQSTSLPTPVPTATPTPFPPASCPNHLADGDFETGLPGAPWLITSSGGSSVIGTENAHAGAWAATLGKVNGSVDTLCQSITIPGDAINLTTQFWWQMWTDEVTHPHDWMELRVRPVGTPTDTVLAHLDDSGLQHRWMPRRVSLAGLAGQTVRLCFVAQTDLGMSTAFFVDDVEVNYCQVALSPAWWLPLLIQ